MTRALDTNGSFPGAVQVFELECFMCHSHVSLMLTKQRAQSRLVVLEPSMLTDESLQSSRINIMFRLSSTWIQFFLRLVCVYSKNLST